METIVKKQKAKVGVAGSFFNQLMSNNSSIPEVGKGATQMHYTDRTCYEVVEVSKDGKTVKLEYLDAECDRTKPVEQGHQNWILKPTGQFITVQWRHNAWRVKSEIVIYTDEYNSKIQSGEVKWEDRKEHFEDSELKLIPGITELKTEWSKINILFGVKDYYYDWSF